MSVVVPGANCTTNVIGRDGNTSENAAAAKQNDRMRTIVETFLEKFLRLAIFSSFGLGMSVRRAMHTTDLPNQVWKSGHADRSTRADEHTDITVPAIISIFHVREARTSETQDVHGAHIDARSAAVAPLRINFNPRIRIFV
jgi:hypothetical protein